MKKIALHSTVAMAAIALSLSCSTADTVEPNGATSDQQQLTALIPNPQTKVDFTDSATEGITLAWEADDSFSVYETNGKWVADFEADNTAESTFVAVAGGGELVDGTAYTAVYPARQNNEATFADYIANDITSEQIAEGDEDIDHLNSACQMSDDFVGGESVAFAHNKAILTVQFDDIPEGKTPSKIEISEGLNKNYSLELNGMALSDGATVYSAHLMIDPAEALDRSITFLVTFDDGVNVYNEATTKGYNAGFRYTAPIKNKVEKVEKGEWITISTAEDLASYVAAPLNNAILTADIDLTGVEITSAGYIAKVFDGNGHSVSNLTIDKGDVASVGLFQGMNSTGVIKNLVMISPKVKGKQYVGAVVGKVMAGGTITNCSVIDGEVESTTNIVGGITGQSMGYTSGCSFTGNVIAATGNVGGIIGIGQPSSDGAIICTLVDCSSSAEITSTTSIGGIVGKATGVVLLNCHSSSTLNSTKDSVGGMIGAGYGDNHITACHNSGSIAGITKIGGMAGTFVNGGTITACYNTGSIGSDATTGSTAGIIGECKETVDVVGCYNYSAFGKEPNGGNIGQIVGYTKAAGAVVTLTDCYYVNLGTGNSQLGDKCDDEAALNAKVEAMNTSINNTAYNTYNFVVGVDNSTPILVKR